jgi:phosphonate transport system substrate-binding protein
MNSMTMTRKTWLKAAAASLTLAATTGVMAQQPTELRVGLIPSEDAQAMMRASQQVMDQLAAKTGMKIKPFVANDYNGVIEAMRSGKIDVAYFGPFSYVLASQLANAEAFAIPVAKKSGKSSYNSIIISKRTRAWAPCPSCRARPLPLSIPARHRAICFPRPASRARASIPTSISPA